MREKELRLALVCFGGISLAVYMHGISKEILKLVRASRTLHRVADRGRRAAARFEDSVPADDPEYDTEAVYFDLLQAIGRRVELRVIVDVIAGASAGGINGVMLARALAHDLPVGHLREMWLEAGDVSELLAQSGRAKAWSKLFMAPLVWMLGWSGRSRTVRNPEVRQKLSLLVRSRWFKPPFDGDKMSELMFDAVDRMGEPADPDASLMPGGQQLEMFVTLTDFYGYQQLIQIHDPAADPRARAPACAAVQLSPLSQRRGAERFSPRQRRGPRVRGARHLGLSRRLPAGADPRDGPGDRGARARLAAACGVPAVELPALPSGRPRPAGHLVHRRQRAQQQAVRRSAGRDPQPSGLSTGRSPARLYRPGPGAAAAAAERAGARLLHHAQGRALRPAAQRTDLRRTELHRRLQRARAPVAGNRRFGAAADRASGDGAGRVRRGGALRRRADPCLARSRQRTCRAGCRLRVSGLCALEARLRAQLRGGSHRLDLRPARAVARGAGGRRNRRGLGGAARHRLQRGRDPARRPRGRHGLAADLGQVSSRLRCRVPQAAPDLPDPGAEPSLRDAGRGGGGRRSDQPDRRPEAGLLPVSRPAAPLREARVLFEHDAGWPADSVRRTARRRNRRDRSRPTRAPLRPRTRPR